MQVKSCLLDLIVSGTEDSSVAERRLRRFLARHELTGGDGGDAGRTREKAIQLPIQIKP